MGGFDLSRYLYPDADQGRQPQYAPQIDWSDPITRGMQGLLWAGPSGIADIVNNSMPVVSTGSRVLSKVGSGITATTSQTAVYVPYTGNQVRLAAWEVLSTPVTLLAFFDPTGFGGATNSYAGVTSGSDGMAIYNTYGTNARRVMVNGVAVEPGGNWTLGNHIHGVVHTGSAIQVIDSGSVFASAADATTAITYSASFTQAQLLYNTGGTGYWMAVWNRALAPWELAALEAQPWRICAPLVYLPFPTGAAALYPTLCNIRFNPATSSGGYPAVDLS